MHRFRNLNPYERHQLIINEYVLNRPGMVKLLRSGKINGKTDIDVIRENHKFLWEDDDVAETWEEQLARKYYDKLFKEYCISDLSRYKENKVALRWRIEREVITGKGQFICGNKICNEETNLRSWEVNFSYMENGEKKNALVKLRLCPICSDKLNYHSKRREIKRLKKQLKKDKKEYKTNNTVAVEKSNQISNTDDIQNEKINKSYDNAEEFDYDKETHDECAEENDINKEITMKEEDHWRKSIEIEEPTREEEFEKYLEDLLL